MKKNKVLSRVYLGMYIVWLFGGLLCPLLLIYASKAVAYVLLAFVILDLACLIVSHVFYTKKKELYPLLSFCGCGVLNIFVIISLILKIVIDSSNPISGRYASPYAWIVIAISLLLLIPIDYYLITKNIKFAKDNNIPLLPKIEKKEKVEVKKEEVEEKKK